MIQIFAEVATEYAAPASAASWLECLFFFVALLGAIKYLLPSKNKMPQPLIVQSEKRLATFEELDQLREEFESFKETLVLDIQNLRDDGERRKDEMNRTIRESSGKVHDRVDAMNQRLGESVAEIKGAIGELVGAMGRGGK